MLNMKALVGIRIMFMGKGLNDECSDCSLLERNLYQYGVHAKLIVFCTGARGEKELLCNKLIVYSNIENHSSL